MPLVNTKFGVMFGADCNSNDKLKNFNGEISQVILKLSNVNL